MTQLSFIVRDWNAKRSYKRWKKLEQERNFLSIENFPNQPKVSFIISMSNAPEADFFRTYRSICGLAGDQWELICVALDKSDSDAYSSLKQDDHFKFISTNVENVLDKVSGDAVLFCKPGDQFSRDLLLRFYEYLDLSTGQVVDVCYFDCEYTESNHKMPLFKPSKISPSLLLSVNYLSRSFVRRSLLADSDFQVKGGSDLLAQEYELLLHLSAAGASFGHIPFVLVSQNELVKTDNEMHQQVVINHLTKKGIYEVEAVAGPHGTQFCWPVGQPSLAIIIPTRENKQMLAPLIDSIANSGYENYTITIVDNGSKDKSLLALYEELEESRKVSIIPYKQAFNYSEAINLGAANSESEILLFLNDDMRATNPFWLKELVQWASLPEIGVVGTKLIRKNYTIQHAGIILGLNAFAGHIYLNAPEHYNGLFGSADWYRNYLAVTGACQMVRREVFEEVGGYDERFSLAFGDIDFCLKIYEQGYSNMYTPFATLYHYEGQSRGYSTPVDDIVNGYERMDGYLREGDPFFSPNLTYTPIPRCNTSSQSTHYSEITDRRSLYQ
ncbi:glycosyltransferase family 2 protein [bacterium]|nr:glycosyltransferase family 2 protein [bacterium]